MDAKNVFLDMLDHFSMFLHGTVADMPDAALQWQPDPEANNIAVTVWHICRALDVLKVKILENLPDQKQLWYDRGWASKTNYNPAGLGFGGFGNLAGYTLDQVKTVPQLSAGELLEYFDQVYDAICAYLSTLTVEAMEQSPAGWPKLNGVNAPQNVYVVLLMFLMDNREHLGEIKVIKAMWLRKYGK